MQDKTVMRESVLACIYATVDEINQTLPGEHLAKSLETRLVGEESVLDSLWLVDFIVSVERRLSTDLGLSVTLADERALSRSRSPFRSVATLTEYVLELVNGQGDDV